MAQQLAQPASRREGLHYNRFSIPGLSRASAAAERTSQARPHSFRMPMQRPRFSPHRWVDRLLVGALIAACLGGHATAFADELGDVQRLYYSGQADVAMQRADRFLSDHPRDPQMRFMKGVMLADAKRNSDAIAVLQKLSDDFPDLAEPYNNLAALYAAEGDYAKARATLEQALRMNPRYATAHENLGDVYAALAAQSYARALKLDPGNVSVPPKLALARGLYKPSGAASAAAAPASAPASSAAR